MSEDGLQHLRPFLNFIPPNSKHESCASPSSSPLHYFNRDLDLGLALKRVVALPTLVPLLLGLAETGIPALEGSGLPGHSNSSLVQPREVDPDVDVTTVRGVAATYVKTVGGPSATMASVFIHNDVGGWSTSVHLIKRSVPHNDFSCSEYIVGVDDMSEGISYEKYVSVLPENIARLKEMWKYTPDLISFQFLRPSNAAADIVKGIRPVRRFDWVSHSTKGLLPFTTIHPEELHDASESLWEKALDQHVLQLRRSERLKDTPKSLPNTARASRFRPGKPMKQDAPYDINPRDFVQELWSHAVRSDVSWLVFHCGTHERICLRHRQTQTLYISDLIEIPGNADYGKIHFGLYLAAVNDSYRRVQFFKTLEQNPTPTLPASKRQEKRKRKDNEARSNISKKRKLEDESLRTLEHCDWILVSSKHDKFNSPAPAFFVRCDLSAKNPMDVRIRDVKSSYPLAGSIELQLSQKIGSGAIGQVHGAHIVSHDASTDPGTPIPIDRLVVKMAFSPHDHTRLLYEATVYAQLTEKKVTSIPRFFGCFRNLEGDALILVMEHGGASLGSIPKFRYMSEESDGEVRPTNAVSVPEPLNGQIKTALQCVHDAGVLHRDIRKWNILVDKDDNPKIIDFDRARFRSSASQKEREMERLDVLLDGIFQDGVAGYGSSRSTGTESCC